MRRSAAPISVLYQGMYAPEAGARIEPADVNAAKAHVAWHDLGKKLSSYASLSKVDDEIIKRIQRIRSSSGGAIDRTSTPKQIRRKREMIKRKARLIYLEP